MSNSNSNALSRLNIKNNIKNIIFDLDGTLYPLKTLKANMFMAALKNPKRAKLFQKARVLMRDINWDDEKYTNRNKFLQRQAACVNTSVEYLNKYYSDMQKRVFKIKPFVGVKDTLYALKTEGYRLFVYSDFPIENKLKELGVDYYFDSAFTSEDTGFLKPDNRGFLYLKEKTGIECYDTLFVGDDKKKDGGFASSSSIAFSLLGRDWVWMDEKEKSV